MVVGWFAGCATLLLQGHFYRSGPCNLPLRSVDKRDFRSFSKLKGQTGQVQGRSSSPAGSDRPRSHPSSRLTAAERVRSFSFHDWARFTLGRFSRGALRFSHVWLPVPKTHRSQAMSLSFCRKAQRFPFIKLRASAIMLPPAWVLALSVRRWRELGGDHRAGPLDRRCRLSNYQRRGLRNPFRES